MSTVILDAFESENPVSNTVKRLFEEKGEKFFYFKLKDVNILPCRSCGSCGIKTPGKCVLNDDMHELYRAIAPSDMLVMLTPVRFGGYSSQLKKAVDRLMLIGMPLYMVKDGHLLHPMRYGNKSLIVVGVTGENLQGQEENFRTLAARNALNMQFAHKTLIFKPSDAVTKVGHEIGTAIREVNQI